MNTDPEQLVDHLFRRHSARIVATLTRVFGSRHLDLAEDVVQDALVKALQQWPFKGVPQNPAAWLTIVAKNRALDVLRRNASLASKAEQLELCGPHAGLAALEEIDALGSLRNYHLLPAVAAEFWKQVGDNKRAAEAYRRALECPSSAPERAFLETQLQRLI